MYIVTSYSKQISSVSACLTVLTGYQKDAGLQVRVGMTFPNPTIYLPALGCQSAANFPH